VIVVLRLNLELRPFLPKKRILNQGLGTDYKATAGWMGEQAEIIVRDTLLRCRVGLVGFG
jgi:hypothetical protein